MGRGRPLAVLGTHGFSGEVLALAEDGGAFEVTHFVENRDRARCAEALHGRPVIWVDDLARLKDTHEVISGIGSRSRREFVAAAEAMGMRFATVVHPSARLIPGTRVGEGSILGLGVLVAHDVAVGRHAILNRGATLGHGTRLGDYVTVGPGTNVAGRVEIGDRAYLGMGVNVLTDLKVGKDAMVGAGSVVTRDVPDGQFVLGYPAMPANREPGEERGG
jgi:sugar O-acyltransferase (sialic acid O-acetyltransferase NeuD family)